MICEWRILEYKIVTLFLSKIAAGCGIGEVGNERCSTAEKGL